MPLFACTKCGCADNTAAALNFWPEYFANNKPPLCSECDPEQAEWHGYFPKQSAKEAAMEDPPNAGWVIWDGKRHRHVNAAAVVNSQ